MIKINNIDKYYNKNKSNELHVIKNVSLELPSTGLVSFLGQSGSGKTTLLNVIGGLDKATGEINYDYVDIKDYNMKKIDNFRRQEIGYVFQNFNLLLDETVYDNLVIALEMIDIYDKDEQDKRIKYVLEAVNMYKYRKKKAYALSGGQQQRIAIARALLKDSKIIIADEPTGNLDSENTIAVMNILKQISKKTLVLMVTHNQDIANFYSDKVFEIKDGSIVSSYDTVPNSTLSTKQSNTVYLKDLNKHEINSELASIEYYTEQDNSEKLTFRIIERAGTYYIESDQNIKIADKTNIKVVDSRYEDLKQENIEECVYDNSWFNNNPTKKKKSRLGLRLKQSYNSMINTKRKTKFVFASFFIIGILFAFCIISLSKFSYIDSSKFTVDAYYDTIAGDDFYPGIEEKEFLNKVLLDGKIENVNRVIYSSGVYSNTINFSEKIDIYFDAPLLPYIEGKNKYRMLAGETPEFGEIIVSRQIADNIIANSKGYFTKYKDLIGAKVSLAGFDYDITISGIIDNPYTMAYLSDELYLLRVSEWTNDKRGIFKFRNYDIEHKYDTYTIKSGRDLNESDKDTNNILYPDTLSALNPVGTIVDIDGINYNIVGTYMVNDLETSTLEAIINSDEKFFLLDNEIGQTFNYTKHKIVSGAEASKQNECVASIYSNVEIGEKVNGCEVVGLFNSSTIDMGCDILYHRDFLTINNQAYAKFFFNTLDKEGVSSGLSTKFRLVNAYDNFYTEARNSQMITLTVFGVFSLILLIIICVFVYFLMRSRMISDIYPIGVYRSLGASKGRIIRKFICDILVITTLTSVIGYIISLVVNLTLAGQVNVIFGENVILNNWYYDILGIFVLYGMNLIFGLLPIINLLRKTPAEIIQKYDI